MSYHRKHIPSSDWLRQSAKRLRNHEHEEVSLRQR